MIVRGEPRLQNSHSNFMERIEKIAVLLEEFVRELRSATGTSKEPLPSLREPEAQCAPAHKREKEKEEMFVVPPVATMPALMTRAEVAELLRIDHRTLDRWRADPRMRFPEPLKRERVIRWRREQIDRWIAGKTP